MSWPLCSRPESSRRGSATALKALEADKKAENGRGITGDLAAVAKLSIRLGRKVEAWDYWLRCFDSAMAIDDPVTVRKALTALISLAANSEETEKARLRLTYGQIRRCGGRP